MGDSTTAAWVRDPRRRRSLTIPAVGTAAAVLGGTIGLWAPVASVIDLASAPRRMPRLRIMSFSLAWSSLETIGVGASGALWAAGRGGDIDAHYALQRWWAARLVDALRYTAGVTFDVRGADHLAPGPIVLAARHASIADSLLPAWLLGSVGLRPRYVLKDDLQLDPCLDIVGNRLPNHFLDRNPDDHLEGLMQLEHLAQGMTDQDAAVIFPEGMVVTEARRRRALERLEQHDPERSARVGNLAVLAPARPRGTAALLRGSPEADLVFVNHTGLERLRRISDAPARLPLAEPVRVDITRVRRSEVPEGDAFAPWLDARWAELDEQAASRPVIVDR
jgi:hypothetical protein